MQNLNLVFIILVFLASCHSSSSTSNLKLNKGEKWVVNVEMKPHIERGQEVLRAYLSQKDTDYKKLALNLKAQNDSLVKSCTMNGESHDELHKWLHPHMLLVEDLTEESDSMKVRVVIEQIEQSFIIYQNYFQ